jgi:hypothetical protein
MELKGVATLSGNSPLNTGLKDDLRFRSTGFLQPGSGQLQFRASGLRDDDFDFVLYSEPEYFVTFIGWLMDFRMKAICLGVMRSPYKRSRRV